MSLEPEERACRVRYKAHQVGQQMSQSPGFSPGFRCLLPPPAFGIFQHLVHKDCSHRDPPLGLYFGWVGWCLSNKRRHPIIRASPGLLYWLTSRKVPIIRLKGSPTRSCPSTVTGTSPGQKMFSVASAGHSPPVAGRKRKN